MVQGPMSDVRCPMSDDPKTKNGFSVFGFGQNSVENLPAGSRFWG